MQAKQASLIIIFIRKISLYSASKRKVLFNAVLLMFIYDRLWKYYLKQIELRFSMKKRVNLIVYAPDCMCFFIFSERGWFPVVASVLFSLMLSCGKMSFLNNKKTLHNIYFRLISNIISLADSVDQMQ